MNGDLRASAVSRKLERGVHIMFRRNKHGINCYTSLLVLDLSTLSDDQPCLVELQLITRIKAGMCTILILQIILVRLTLH